MNVIKTIWRGCGTTKECGSHPGTGFLVLFIAMGGAAGAKNGVVGIVFGALFLALIMGPIYLAGAYSRGKIKD